MNHQKAAYQICATQRDTLISELAKVGQHPECTEAVWKGILAAMNAALDAARAKEKEIRSRPDDTGDEAVDSARLDWLERHVLTTTVGETDRFARDVFATWPADRSLRAAIDEARQIRP